MKLAIDIKKDNGAKLALAFSGNSFDYSIFKCSDLHGTIEALKKKKHSHCGLMASLPASNEESFALLYDFVDAFLITEYEDLNDSIDPLLRLRLYNDDYKQIFLKIPETFFNDELEEVISFSLLSNIDGLYITNPRQLSYVKEKSNSMLQIITGGVDSEDKMEQAKKDGVDIAAIPYLKKYAFPFISLWFARRWIRKNF